MSTTAEHLVEALAAHIAESIAALLGEPATPSPSTDPGDVGWVATVSCAGSLEGQLVVGVPEADGRRIAALVMATEHDVPDDAVIDTLTEVCRQAVGALSASGSGLGLQLAVIGVERSEGSVDGRGYSLTLPGGATAHLVVRSTLQEPSSTMGEADVVPSPRVQPAAAPGPVRETPAANVRNLDVLLDIELPLAVRFGQTELPLLTLVRLGPGSVIDLKRSADEPVDVLVSGKVIARGEVVVVDGNYGVRVTEIVSTAERIRSIGA